MGDQVQLQQVFLNLLSERMDAMANVEENQRPGDFAAVMALNAGHPAVYDYCARSGIGLSQGKSVSFSRRSIQPKPRPRYGLGNQPLDHRKLMEESWAESNEGSGAIFAFCLPALPLRRQCMTEQLNSSLTTTRRFADPRSGLSALWGSRSRPLSLRANFPEVSATGGARLPRARCSLLT